ncbi:MAG: sugar phosphate nucleotidyltransferase [Fimbriimonadaceae bacterium]
MREGGLKAVVMAGGEGSRLRPITLHRPKPLVPVGNVPIMEHILGLVRRHGMTDVVATLHYLSDEIQRYFGDGSDFGVRLEYSIETVPLGTAGSVKQAEASLRDGTFVIISGDAMTDCDLTKALAFHREKGSVATLVLYRVPSPLEFGVVITDDESRIVRFLEKPGWSEVFSDTVNTGIYILEPEVLDLFPPDTNVDWSQNVFPEILARGMPLYGYVMEGYWCDVGSLPQYVEAQRDLLSGQTMLRPAGNEVSPGVFIGEGTVIEDGAELVAPVCIGRGSKVKRGAILGPNSVVGDNALVESFAQIEHSVVWDSAYIGSKAHVSCAILGSRVTVKRDCRVMEDAVVGDRCLLDAGCTVRPRVRLWPDKIIDRGATVTMSVISGNKWRGALFRELGVAGISNIEITPDFACRLGAAYGSTLPRGSKVVTSRDSTRSSRMIKRAIISSLLSVGCDVLDLRSTPLPIVKHFIKSSGAAGAIHTRKLPGNARVTLMEMFDSKGAYLPPSQERKVETTFFREDFLRIDSDDLGVIDFASRAVEEYEADFFRKISPPEYTRPMRIVVDYGFFGLASIFPTMLARLGIDAIGLNAYNDAKRAPRNPEAFEEHVRNLAEVVGKLDYELGILFAVDGERMTLIDGHGSVLSGYQLLGLVTTLAAATQPGVAIGLPVTAPDALVLHLESQGARVTRTKSDARSLIRIGLEHELDLCADHNGGFIFPGFHAGFDAMFAFGRLASMLREQNTSVTEAVAELPPFSMATRDVACPWELKGAIMRHVAEKADGAERSDLTDGIKIYQGDAWSLVLPDAVEPAFHIHAEGLTQADAERLAQETADMILKWVASEAPEAQEAVA